MRKGIGLEIQRLDMSCCTRMVGPMLGVHGSPGKPICTDCNGLKVVVSLDLRQSDTFVTCIPYKKE